MGRNTPKDSIKVMVSIRKAKQTPFQLRRKGRRGNVINAEAVGLLAAGLCIGVLLMFLYTVAFSEDSRGARLSELRKIKKHPVLMETTEDGDAEGGNGNNSNVEDPNHPPIRHKQLRPMGDGMNAIALEIATTLDCETLLKEAEDDLKNYNQYAEEMMDDVVRRRLQQHADDGGLADLENSGGDIQKEQNNQAEEDKDASPFGDDLRMSNDYGDFRFVSLSAKHLFCIAASEKSPEKVTEAIMCDGSKKKRKMLLELWTAARAQMPLDLMLKVLGIARESSETILGTTYNLWAPENDDGHQYMLGVLNEEKDVDAGGLIGLDEALGEGKTFVDVGSCLGLTCLVINDKYPGTKIVSVEPASPSWLLQEINLRCNVPSKKFNKNMKIILGGVGANTDEEDYTSANFMWRPTSTTSTRSWTPESEKQDNDEELVVPLRNFKSIMAEARVDHVDVLNLDCQGCEYNMIPTMTKEEFEEIPTVMGSVHWGYIDIKKLPSSMRGETTHQRLCEHENIAHNSKECCAFKDMAVKSSIPGEVLQKNESNGQITVLDIIDEGLCDDFDAWAIKHYLNEVPDDFGWFDRSSQA